MKASFEQTKKIEDLIRLWVDHQKKNFLKKGTMSLFNKKNAQRPQNFELAL